MTNEIDAYDAAMQAEYTPGPRVYFGEVQVDVYSCILVKGTGKVPFDPDVHSQDRRRTAITLILQPLPGSKYENPIERQMIAESEEWAKIIKPSLRALNADLRGINGKWAQVEIVPTGRKYTNKNGEEKDSTTLVFKAIYQTEDECMVAANARFYPDREDLQAPTTPAPAANGNAERETARKFLPALWRMAGGDLTEMAKQLAKNPLTSKHFTIESPEVLETMPPF